MILIIINLVNFCFEFLQKLSMPCEAISNTRKSVSSKTRLSLVFSTHFSVFEYLMCTNSAVARGGAGGARAPPVFFLKSKNRPV